MMSFTSKVLRAFARKSNLPAGNKLRLIRVNQPSVSCSSEGTGDGGRKCEDGADKLCTKTMYESRKFGHCLPRYDNEPYFEALPNVPTGVFRYTEGERLGPCASKCNFYKNPEYFSFHHMTFYDMQLILRNHRIQCPKSGRKP